MDHEIQAHGSIQDDPNTIATVNDSSMGEETAAVQINAGSLDASNGPSDS